MRTVVTWLIAVLMLSPSLSLAQQESPTWQITTYKLDLRVPSKDDWPLGWLGRDKYVAREKKDNPALWVRHPKDKPQLQGRMDFEAPGSEAYTRDSYVAAAGRWYAVDDSGGPLQHFGRKLGEKTETIGKITYTKLYHQWAIANGPQRHNRNVIFVFFEYGDGWRGYGMFVGRNIRWITGANESFAEAPEALVNTFLAGLSPQ